MRPGVLLIAALAAGVAVAACDSDPQEPLGTAPTYQPRTAAGELLGRRHDASAPVATDAAPASTRAVTSVPAAAPTVAPEAPAVSRAAKTAPAPPVACGDKPAPPCPLAAWMKANASPAITSPNFDALAEVLDKTAAFAPDGYPNWASISRDGADAARAQGLDAVKASCRSCHNQYRGRYKAEMRARPLPL